MSFQHVSLKSSRNMVIMGIAIIVGMTIPDYFEDNPIDTGIDNIDQMLNILLTIRMFVGGFIAFILDNIVSGATREQRGFRNTSVTEILEDTKDLQIDGYSFPESVNRFLLKIPLISKIPFMPSTSSLKASLSVQSLLRKRDQ